MKIRATFFTSLFTGISLYACEISDSKERSVTIINNTDQIADSTMKLGGFDWTVDPLIVSIDEENLSSSIGRDDLESIRQHVYNYFHLQQTGDIKEFKQHFRYYPKISSQDTNMIKMIEEGTMKWWSAGYRNCYKSVDINYASDWIEDGNKKVTLIGFDLLFEGEYSSIYQGNPSGTVDAMRREVSNSSVEYLEDGDMRKIVVKASKGLFVISHHDEESYRFYPEHNANNNGLDAMISRDVRLKLLRTKRDSQK